MEIPETKRFIPKGFELGTTLSQPNWSILLIQHNFTTNFKTQLFIYKCLIENNAGKTLLTFGSRRDAVPEGKPVRFKAPFFIFIYLPSYFFFILLKGNLQYKAKRF